MTKTEQLKAAQGYRLIAPICRTCKHFTSDKLIIKSYFGVEYIKEKNKRCGIGGFSVKVTATCLKWEEK